MLVCSEPHQHYLRFAVKLPVCSAAFWLFHGTSGIHQDVSPNLGFVESEGDPNCRVLGLPVIKRTVER